MTKNLALWLILVLALSYGVFQSINPFLKPLFQSDIREEVKNPMNKLINDLDMQINKQETMSKKEINSINTDIAKISLNNEEERFIGEAYTTQFTIPVKFELDYHNSDDEIPTFEIQEEVMDFIEQKEELFSKIKTLNIPLEKFRWTWSLKNSKLTIKGKTTGLVVLKPLIKPYGELEHIKPDTNNKRLYAMN